MNKELQEGKEEKNEGGIELETMNEKGVECIEMILGENEEKNFDLGGILVETNRTIEKHKKDNIDMR